MDASLVALLDFLGKQAENNWVSRQVLQPWESLYNLQNDPQFVASAVAYLFTNSTIEMKNTPDGELQLRLTAKGRELVNQHEATHSLFTAYPLGEAVFEALGKEDDETAPR